MRIINFADAADLELHYPLFFQERYAGYERSKGWEVILLRDDHGTLIPLKRRKAKFIKQAQYLYPPLRNGQRLSAEDEKKFMENLILFCRQNGLCDFIAPPQHFSLFQMFPSGSYYTEIGIITLELQKSEEELFMATEYNCRNKIRKAIKEGLTVDFGNHYFEAFYELYKDVHKSQGLYFDSFDDLKNMVTILGENNCVIAVAKKESQIIAAELVLFSANEAYSYHAGSLKNSPYHGANNLQKSELIKWLKSHGVTRYCMGGSRLGDIRGTKYEGIQNFKLSFGAQIEKGFHFYSEITWRYKVYKTLLNLYLKWKGIPQNTTGLNYRYASCLALV